MLELDWDLMCGLECGAGWNGGLARILVLCKQAMLLRVWSCIESLSVCLSVCVCMLSLLHGLCDAYLLHCTRPSANLDPSCAITSGTS